MEKITATLSFHMDSKSNMKHDLRQIYVPYVDTNRSKNNVYYCGNTTLEEAYEFLFADAIAEYNARQPRPERRIDNYLQKLIDAEKKQEQLIQEKRSAGCSYKELAKYKKSVHPSMQFIVTIGNMQSNPELIAKDGKDAERAKAVLEAYMNGFQERNPNCHLVCAALHGDEVSVWHGHFTICWFADDCPKGMKRQVSQKRALEAMGFVSDTEKGEDGKLHLAIEKWQNREREILQQLCQQHGITICAGNGSREHLDREHYIISKKHEENEKKEAEIHAEHEQMMTAINDQAGIILSEKEKVDKQVQKIQHFLNETNEGKNFLVYSQIEDLQSKATAFDAQKQHEKELLAQLWEEYKTENSTYWSMYKSQKQAIYSLLQNAKSNKQYNDRMLYQYLHALSDRSENLLFKLFSLIAVLTLTMRKMYLDAELDKVQKEYTNFKNHARTVLHASKDTSIALKTKDFDNIEEALNRWHIALSGINRSIDSMQNIIAEKDHNR